jgi:serine/threonine protein kinase
MSDARPPGIPADNPASPAPLPPRYRFEATLGEGGLGTVVKAYDTQLHVHVAIKAIRHDLARTDPTRYEYSRARFEREAIAGALVRSSPYVVTVYDQIVGPNGDLFLILEYVTGGTLRDRLVGGPLPVAAALRLAADVARGLMALHEADMVHRDIKPENIFIAADGRAQVGDLGIVQMSATTFRTRLEYGSPQGHPGTPLYMSPEQANTTDALTPEADQYSLGTVLFETATGKRYKGVYADEREALLGGLPTGMGALIRRMTAADPATRYRGMEAVLAAIQAINPNAPPERAMWPTPPEPTRAQEATFPETWAQTPRVDLRPAPPLLDPRTPAPLSASRPVRRRAVIAGIGGLVLASGAAGGLWAANRHGPAPLPPTLLPPTIPPPSATPPRAPTAPPGTATPALSGTTDSWTDPEHRLTVRYPTTWSKDSFEDTRDENSTLTKVQPLLELTGPNEVSVNIGPYVSPDTLDSDVTAARALTTSGSSPITLTPTRDTVIGGEPAKTFDGTYTQNGNTVAAAVWMVGHGNKRFLFSADKIGTHRSEVDAIVGAVTFQSAVGTPAGTATATPGSAKTATRSAATPSPPSYTASPATPTR